VPVPFALVNEGRAGTCNTNRRVIERSCFTSQN